MHIIVDSYFEPLINQEGDKTLFVCRWSIKHEEFQKFYLTLPITGIVVRLPCKRIKEHELPRPEDIYQDGRY
jgi:hypothetical protein